MGHLVDIVILLARETWAVLVAGLVIILSLAMLAHAIRATVGLGMGSGLMLGEAVMGIIGPLVVGLFLFIGVPPLVQSLSTISSCTSTFADLTGWAQRLLAAFIAFRMLKVGYLAIVAEAIGTGEAAAMLLNEAAGVVAAMLMIPFIGAIASTLLGC